MSTPRAVVFDLDQTLAESKSPMTSDMGRRLAALAERAPVAIISGAKFAQFEIQELPAIPATAYPHTYLLPTSGAALYHFTKNGWEALYEERLAPEEAARIESVIEKAVRETGTLRGDEPAWGPRIEYRGSQVTFSAFGQIAPFSEKVNWDSDKSKRMKLREALMPLLPEYEIGIGGATSVDIVRKGINKAFGVCKLAEHLGIAVEDMLYVGDDLQEGGNDFVVVRTGIKTRAVKNPSETACAIDELLETFP